MLAPFGCGEVKVVHGEEEDQSAGRLVVLKFPDGARDEEQGMKSKGPQVQKKIQNKTMGRKEDLNRKSLCNRIPIRPRKRTIRLRQEGCPAWTSTSSETLKTARTRWKLEKIRRELDEMTKTMLSMEEDRDMWKRLFEN